MEVYTALLREVENRVGLPSIRQIALRPGVFAVYRVIVQYDRMRAADAVTTLTRTPDGNGVVEVVYAGHFGNHPIVRSLPRAAYENFASGLGDLRFDKLPDQPNIPFYGVDMWLFERAAGGFHKSVLLAPQAAEGMHAQLAKLIKAYMPESIREIVT